MRKLLVVLVLLMSVGMAGEGQSVELDFGKEWHDAVHELPQELVVTFEYSRNRKAFIAVN
ncbi:hypothetical protein KAU11_07215 [Candidatus Babeliales bacterium]|nr:hypothetical protein [Candidatus Babeliales bacterium]